MYRCCTAAVLPQEKIRFKLRARAAMARDQILVQVGAVGVANGGQWQTVRAVAGSGQAPPSTAHCECDSNAFTPCAFTCPLPFACRISPSIINHPVSHVLAPLLPQAKIIVDLMAASESEELRACAQYESALEVVAGLAWQYFKKDWDRVSEARLAGWLQWRAALARCNG